jgi:hypothetical protein
LVVQPDKFVKLLIAILCSVLLVWTPFAPAQALPACAKPAMNCGGAGCHMPCCAAKNSSNPQSQPAVPAQKVGAPGSITLLAPNVAAWILPESPAASISPVAASPLTAARAALYARDCARLI